MRPENIKICYVASADITLRFILWNHLKFFKKEGFNVSAVCSPGKWVKDVEDSGIGVKLISFKRKFSPFSDIVSFIRLYLYFRKEKFHIVHTHTLKPEFYGQIAAKLAGVPIIINTLHGFDFAEDAPYLKKKFFITLERIAAKCSSLIFSVNKKNINTVIQEKICDSSKIKYIGNGIDLERFSPQRFEGKFISSKKAELGIRPNSKIIGIVARLVKEKGYLDLFESFKYVLKEFPDTYLLVVGPLEPDKKDAINPKVVDEYGIGDNVIFLGEKAKVEEIYPLMDIFILPSHREGLPYTILEASAAERPVISTNVGGCPEAVDADKTGLLIKSKSPEKIADAIIFLLSNPEIALKMGQRGRERARLLFDEKLVFDRLYAEYEKLIKEKIAEAPNIRVCCVVSADITLKFMLFNQLKFLQKQGYKIHAVCSPGKWVKDVEDSGIGVKLISFKRKFSPFSDIVSFIRLYLYFRKEKFHIVHTHTLKPEFYGQIAAKLAGVPIIINTLHGFDFAEDAPYLKKKFFITLERIAAKCSSLIFSISQKIIKIAIEEKICKPELIEYLGRDIDVKRFDPQKFSAQFIENKKREFGIPKNARVIGIIARLVGEKGFIELFLAFKNILEKEKNIFLIVVGPVELEKSDSIKPEIVNNYGIQEKVLFLGDRTDVEEIYAVMDIFVLPSHREGLGAAILEASAMQKPVIATNIGGCQESVDHDNTGILVPAKDSGELARAINYLLNSPVVAKEMGERGREKILKEFDEEKVFARLKRAYQKIIEERL